MAIVNVSSLATNVYINDISVGCAQDVSLEEGTLTADPAQASTATALCRADIAAAQAAAAAGGNSSAAGTWASLVAGANYAKLVLDGIVRIEQGGNDTTNIVYDELVALKDLGQPVKIAFGTNISGYKKRVGQAFITNLKQISSIDPAKPVVTFTMELSCTGPLTFVTNP
jgi:hypothetical protein